MRNLNVNDLQRFWAFVNKGPEDQCWEWAGSKLNNYGGFWFNGKMKLAHQISYFISVGVWPEGFQVLHSCDNPICCNPKHLFDGSQADNMRDRANKNRQNTKPPINTLLTKDDVIEIRRRGIFEQGKIIHKDYANKVSLSSIYAILQGRTFKDITLIE